MDSNYLNKSNRNRNKQTPFSENETILYFKVSSKAYTGEKMVLCSTKEASKSNSKRAAFFCSFCRRGEMCRHKNTIGSLLGLPNFISVRASLSLPVEVSFLSKGNIFVFLTFILRHFHWMVKLKIKWLEFSLYFWS